MKKEYLVIPFIVLFASAAIAIPPESPGTKKSGNIIVTKSNKALKIPQHTVATLPTLTTSEAGAMVQVTDGADTSDCTVGGGAGVVTCRWSGSAWASIGDGVGAGTASGTVATLDGTGDAGAAATHSRGDHKHAVTPAGIGAQPTITFGAGSEAALANAPDSAGGYALYNANTTVLGATIGAAEVDADVATQAELDTVAALVDTDDEIIAIINASPSTQIGVPAGGTGAGTHTDGGLLVGAGTGALEALAVGLTTQVLVGGGAGTNPAWGTDLPTAVTIGSAYIYRVGGTDVADADVADDITVSNYLPLAGGTLTNTLITDASDATASGIRLPHGAAPDTPTNGDLWTTTAGLYARINGATVGPYIDAAGATAYDAIGDPTGAGLITFDATETATYDGAWNNEVAITISLNVADLTGDTTGLLITSVDNDDPNFLPLRIQDDQDGTPDDLFKVDYQGVATAAGGFVGNLTGDASGSAASITGDLDPDQLSGDATDDNLVDQDIIEGMATTGVTTPGFTAYDSDLLGADKTAGAIYWNGITLTDGLEDVDFFVQTMQGGVLTEILTFDESDDRWETTKAFLSSGAISAGAGVDLGTSQALTGTTAMTIGNNGQTVAINSSDWDIDATGIMTGMGNITSNGTIEGATLTEGGNAVYNASETPGGELEGTWATPTLDNTGITLTSITIGALLGVDSIDATGAVPMAYGSADVTSHTFTSDGGATVIDGSTITVPAADNPYIVLDDNDDMDVYIINDDVGAELEFSTDSTVSQNNLATLSEAGTFTTTAGVTVGTLLATTPQSLTVTTEVDVLSLTGSLLLVTGDNDTDNDTVDLQNGTVTGQQLIIVGVALIDADDTITFAMTDTTCTGCQTVLLDEIGDTWTLVWTGSTWATTANSEVP